MTIDVALAQLADPGLTATRSSRFSPTAPRSAAARRRELPRMPASPRGRGHRNASMQFIARHREIVVGDGAVRVSGPGDRVVKRRRPRGAGPELVGREVLVLGAARPAQAAPRDPPRAHPRQRLCRRGRDPGHPADGAATRRQRRHGRACHGQLRARRAASHRPARRLAEREGADRSLRRQPHHRRRHGVSVALARRSAISTGSRPRQRASATCASP